MGMVSEVFRKDELHEKVTQIAEEIVNKPLSALIAAKQVLKESENLGMK